jgi:hypothetical protein
MVCPNCNTEGAIITFARLRLIQMSAARISRHGNAVKSAARVITAQPENTGLMISFFLFMQSKIQQGGKKRLPMRSGALKKTPRIVNARPANIPEKERES